MLIAGRWSVMTGATGRALTRERAEASHTLYLGLSKRKVSDEAGVPSPHGCINGRHVDVLYEDGWFWV